MVPGSFTTDDTGASRASAILRDVASLSAAADYERIGLQGHAAEELLAGAFNGLRRHEACGLVEAGFRVAHEACKLGMVGRANVYVRKGICEI